MVNPLLMLGKRISAARRRQRIKRADLGRPYFSKKYITALERGEIYPSTRALALVSDRLNIPASELQVLLSAVTLENFSASIRGESIDRDIIESIEEGIQYDLNHAKRLIRDSRVDEGLDLIGEAAERLRAYEGKVPGRTRYAVPYSTARAYVQRGQLSLARVELEKALVEAAEDHEATARIRNMLGAIMYSQEHPMDALDQHWAALHAVQVGRVYDLNLRASLYQNLANDYWALDMLPQAIYAYKEALHLLPDVNDSNRQGELYWGLGAAYKASGDHAQAILSAMRALQAFETVGNRRSAASAHIYIGEVLLEEHRYEEAKEYLNRAEASLSTENHPGLLSLLHRAYADLALEQEELELASQHAKKSMQYGEALVGSPETTDNNPWIDPRRTYAEALHIAALVEEQRGCIEDAAGLFKQALDQVNQTTQKETIRAISLSYAAVLRNRGAYKEAVQLYLTLASPGFPGTSP